MSSCASANLVQAELIRRYCSRQSGRLGTMSLEDAANQWIGKRAAKFRAYWLRRQIQGDYEFTPLARDPSTSNSFA